MLGKNPLNKCKLFQRICYVIITPFLNALASIGFLKTAFSISIYLPPATGSGCSPLSLVCLAEGNWRKSLLCGLKEDLKSKCYRLQESKCYFLNTVWTVPMVESPLSSRGQDFPSSVNTLSEASCVLDRYCVCEFSRALIPTHFN